MVLLTIHSTSLDYGLFAQKYDYNYIHKFHKGKGALLIEYSDSTSDISVGFIETPYEVYINSGITLNDHNGNLIGYFNGFSLYNADGSLAVNGDDFGLRSSLGRIWWQIDSLGGIPVANTGLILPVLDEFHFALFTMSFEQKESPGFELLEVYDQGFLIDEYASELLFTLIKINQDGLLEVVENKKEVPIKKGFFRAEISACKHANGEDWWILLFDRISDSMYSILFSNDTTIKIDSSSYPGQNATFSAGGGNAVFSPDGSKYAKLHYRMALDENYQDVMPALIEVMKFNRCTGNLEAPYVSLNLDKGEIIGSAFCQIAFSKSGRFLYFANTEYLLQFDLYEDTLNSPDTIAYWDNLYYRDSPGHPGVYTFMWRIPNNAIVLPWILTSNFHIIHDPDKKGRSSNFTMNHIEGPDNPFNLEFPFPMGIRSSPYWPEYRMPAMNRPCESNKGSGGISDCIQILPNPFDAELFLKCLTTSDQGSVVRKVEVYNILGQLIHKDTLLESDFGKHIDTNRWPAGTYIVVLRDSANSIIRSVKVVKQ